MHGPTVATSGCLCPMKKKRIMESLGLHKMNQTVEHEDTPNILGMINKVNHLVSVETK